MPYWSVHNFGEYDFSAPSNLYISGKVFLIDCSKKIFHLLLLLLYITSCYPRAVFSNDFAAGKRAYLSKDYEQALQILRPLAQQQDGDAQIILGLMYEYGYGVPRDMVLALDWYQRAAVQGHALMQYDLGVRYFKGQGVPIDYQEASRWWLKAEGSGLADASYNLALLHYHGMLGTVDYVKARQLFIEIAENDHVQAQYALALMYLLGQGGLRDYADAFKWFEKAAEKNQPEAQYNLGLLLIYGLGAQRDVELAKKWFEKAAENGLKRAKMKLTDLSNTGDIIQPTPEAVGEKLIEEIGNVSSAPNSIHDTNHTVALNRSAWLKTQSTKQYTIQLASVLNYEQIVQFIETKDLITGDVGYIEVMANGNLRYTVIYGLYSRFDEAQAMAEQLSKEYQLKPWVRNIGKLQQTLK